MDTDCDGMADAWELAHFGTLAHDGSEDFDGGGFTDLQELQNGTDPKVANAPGIPQILQPEDGADVLVPQPPLEVQNSIRSSGLLDPGFATGKGNRTIPAARSSRAAG